MQQVYHASWQPSHQTSSAPGTLAEALYSEGYEALHNGETQRAQLAFSRLASITPRQERAWLGLGASLEQQAHYERALGVYTLGEALDADSFFCPLGKARVLARLARPAEARSLLQRLEANTDDPERLALIERLEEEL